MVASVNENGRRSIPIFNNLSAQLAHILVFYRSETNVISHIFKLIEKYSQKYKRYSHCKIGSFSKLTNCLEIKDVQTGQGAVISGALRLSNGTINSTLQAPAFVGTGVIAEDFIFSTSSKVSDNALITRCFVGEGCEISKGFSAVDCLFFANCEMTNGEAVSVFAAPYSCSHHKNSLLIANALSFANIGSGTNMSNHAYKLGAVHQGVMERGCKTASNSYMLFPAHIGAFSTIFGSHKNHPDIADLPFSYLVEEKGESYLLPAANLFRLGTLRDVYKWQSRDKRQAEKKLDLINYKMLNPFIINKIERGIEILQNLKDQSPDTEIYEFGNCKIRKNALKKGIEHYQNAITIFLGDWMQSGIIRNNIEILDFYKEWIDLSGLLVPEYQIDYLLKNIEKFNLAQIRNFFNSEQKNYEYYLSIYIIGKDYLAVEFEELIQIKRNYCSILTDLKKRLVLEANKEFYGEAKIGYGLDYKEFTDKDFEQVRGKLTENSILNAVLQDFDAKIARVSENIFKEKTDEKL
jgi:hypothetical protein